MAAVIRTASSPLNIKLRGEAGMGMGVADIRYPAVTAPTPICAMVCVIQMAPCPHNFRVAARAIITVARDAAIID